MVTKANRSKAAKIAEEAQERIEKAKQAYGVAEVNVDNWLLRLAASPWTLAVTLAALCGVIVLLIL